MRLGLLLGLVGLALLLVWLLAAPRRPSEASLPPLAEARNAEVEQVLAPAAAEEAATEEARKDPVPHSAPRRMRSISEARPEPSTAPIRGRVVVAETLDPLEAVLTVRLRTIDLEEREELHTGPDGTFQGLRPFARGVMLALVKDDEGNELVDHEALFDPEAEGDWLVPVPDRRWPTTARGRVVDRKGASVPAARVSIVGLGAELPYGEERSDGEGLFELGRLRAGPYRLHVQGSWVRSEPLEVRLRTGPNELGDLVLDEPLAAGELRLRLVGLGQDVFPEAWFELRERSGRFAQRFDASRNRSLEGGGLEILLERIPAGRYTLRVHGTDGLQYEPTEQDFSPPATLEIRVTGTKVPGTLFRARDLATREPLLGFQVLGRRGRTWIWVMALNRVLISEGRVSRQTPAEEVRLPGGWESWIVWAPGYKAACGRASGETKTIVAELEAGWSELYQFEDAEGDLMALPGLERFQEPSVLAGVEVRAEDRLAGTSDEDGFFALLAEREPETIGFRRPGWRVVGEEHLGPLRTVSLVQSP